MAERADGKYAEERWDRVQQKGSGGPNQWARSPECCGADSVNPTVA